MYAASWSGGKDSCLACHHAITRGLKVSHLIHFDRPNNLHGVDPALIRLQAKLAGIPMIQEQVAQKDFERVFKQTVISLKREGVRGMIFGDIYLEAHKEWIDRMCEELGIEAVLPLWGRNTKELLREFLDLGFVTVVASGDQNLIEKQWIGRNVDNAFIEYLETKDLDVCGEDGEFHTFVTTGPMFSGKIVLEERETTERDGFRFLNIKKYSVQGR